MKKNSLKDVTIAIVTRNRRHELLRLLTSLYKTNYSHCFNKIIIISNGEKVLKLQDITQIKSKLKNAVLYHFENLGKSDSRNYAISQASSPYLLFLDDDVLVNKQWIKSIEIILTQKKNNPVVFIQGNVLEYYDAYKNDIFTRITQLLHTFDYQKITTKNGYLLDTKNVLLNLDFIKEKKLSFDTGYDVYGYGEDTDIGLAIIQQGGQGFVAPKKMMIVLHTQKPGFLVHIKNQFRSGKSSAYIALKFNKKKKIIWELIEIFKLLVYLKKTEQLQIQKILLTVVYKIAYLFGYYIELNKIVT